MTAKGEDAMFAEHYLLVKNIHIALVLLSGGLFMLRGLWVLLAGSGNALQKKVNRLSYIIDTCLLLAAFALLEIRRASCRERV